MVELIVNDIPVQYTREPSLFQLIQDMKLDWQTGIAVAVNQAVIPKMEWATTTLRHQDNVLLIKATQGG